MRTVLFVLGISFLQILSLHWNIPLFSSIGMNDKILGWIIGFCLVLDIIKK